jgi:hypothetical protein
MRLFGLFGQILEPLELVDRQNGLQALQDVLESLGLIGALNILCYQSQKSPIKNFVLRDLVAELFGAKVDVNVHNLLRQSPRIPVEALLRIVHLQLGTFGAAELQKYKFDCYT